MNIYFNKSKKLRILNLLLFFFLFANCSFANIWLPSILSNNMVLQQNSNATIWGWTTSTSETIKVTGSWNNEEFTVNAYQGVWSIKLRTPSAGGPFSITIEGHEKITLLNILIGEVWLCSGQSNMEWTPKKGLKNAEDEISKANFPEIRFFTVPKHTSTNPQDDSFGNWQECNPETMKNFSSVGYFFGRKLHKDLSIPIGLINSSWGGTNVETWTPKEVVQNNPALINSLEKIPEVAWWPSKEALTYNAMIYPLINYDIAGAIWYQGESNRRNSNFYYDAFPKMINSWRTAWNKEFPFYFVQIAPFNYKSSANIDAALVRDAQLHTMLTVPNTGMAVTNDIGNLKNIHPINKQDVGSRLALWALAKTYGVKDLVFSGPVYKSMEIKKRKIIIGFDYAENGLIKKGERLDEFYIAGTDKKFYKAKTKIIDNKVVVSSSEVKEPVAVRFAFSDTALPNLFNKSGLPATAFRTDDWEINLE